MKNKKKKQGNIEKGKLYKLVMNLEFDNPTENENFKSKDYEGLVDSAIKRVLGEAAPLYQFLSYDVATRRGSLLLKSEDFSLIWGALTIYGCHFEQKIALHFYNLLSQ
uniref:Uncharacterized protein n=1 Tax=Meloidogyne enterolobii TaxID=390850 RepID=A0A6V7X4K3_MELEN|nr:unnamed protein product [Meloidogyne enterolobii]